MPDFQNLISLAPPVEIDWTDTAAVKKATAQMSFEADKADVVSAITHQPWSPIIWSGARSKENFFQSKFLVYDVDENLTLDEAKRRLDEAGYKYLIALSRNHQREKHGKVEDRFRVVLELNRLVQDWHTYSHTWEHFRTRLLAEADQAAGLATQIFYPCSELKFAAEGALVEPVEPAGDSLVETSQNSNVIDLRDHGLKGHLSRRTLQFLTFGAEDGQWNREIFLAARDANEQGYTEKEFIELATKVTGYLDGSDRSTISSAYKYDSGNELRASEESIEAAEKSYSLFDRLPDTKDFLTHELNTRGHSTGFKELDRRLGYGLLPRYFTGLTAPGKSGKTTFLTQLVFNLAKAGVKTGMMSLEMSPFRHMIPSLLSIGYNTSVRTLPKADINKLFEEVPNVLPFLNNINFFNKMGATKPGLLVEWIKFQYEKHGTEVFMLDHVGYSLEDIADRKQHSELAKALRKICDELPIHLIAIIQPKNLEWNGPTGRQRASKHTLYGGATWSQDLNQLLVLDRDPKHPNTSHLYLTDTHNPMAETSETDAVSLIYDKNTCSLSE